MAPSCRSSSVCILSCFVLVSRDVVGVAPRQHVDVLEGGGLEQSHVSFFQNGRAPCHENALPKQQLRGDILDEICEKLGEANFLVFGDGFDSPFWLSSNPNGKTVFLEHHKEWIDKQPSEVRDKTLQVTYSSDISTAEKDISNEEMLSAVYKQLPQDVLDTDWAEILVDSPEGDNNPGRPGRGQSIYAAMKLAKPHTTIFVDDCNRKVETSYIKYWLEKNGRTVKRTSNGHGGETCTVSAEPESGLLQKDATEGADLHEVTIGIQGEVDEEGDATSS